MIELGPKTPEHQVIPKSEFVVKLENLWTQDKFVCVGLDPEYSKIPQDLKTGSKEDSIIRFNQEIIDVTSDLVCAYKLNTAFYEAHGLQGISALIRSIKHIKENYPDIPVILDAKRADIGNTNIGYVSFAFNELNADAITVHNYLGVEAMKPFLDRKNKGIIVLTKTSNSGAGEIQDLRVGIEQEPLYKVIARNVVQSWNENGNCAIVVGATYRKELGEVRAIVGDMPILIPGIGTQGGNVGSTVSAGKDSRGWGMIINSSRGIIYSPNARNATQQLREEINKYR